MEHLDNKDFKVWTIKKGHHYCTNLLRVRLYLKQVRLSYDVIFTDSCAYTMDYPHNLDVNKLFGLSYGAHHNNSVRFGWHSNNGIQLFAYYYINGVRKEDWICCLKPNIQYKFTIIRLADKYSLVITGADNFLKQKIVDHPVILPNYGYELFPYMGGTQTAVQDIKILMHRNE
jgi:hypothetical protein